MVRIREFYHNGREKGPMTDEQYHRALLKLAGGGEADSHRRPVGRQLYPVHPGTQAVKRPEGEKWGADRYPASVGGAGGGADSLPQKPAGIPSGSSPSTGGKRGGAKEAPLKENDHAMDDVRYFVETVVYGGRAFSFE